MTAGARGGLRQSLAPLLGARAVRDLTHTPSPPPGCSSARSSHPARGEVTVPEKPAQPPRKGGSPVPSLASHVVPSRGVERR